MLRIGVERTDNLAIVSDGRRHIDSPGSISECGEIVHLGQDSRNSECFATDQRMAQVQIVPQ
ncbi:hypothetical protein D3C80_2140250 [compost metagenome]